MTLNLEAAVAQAYGAGRFLSWLALVHELARNSIVLGR